MYIIFILYSYDNYPNLSPEYEAPRMKSAIFAKNTHIVGLVTFLSGLMQAILVSLGFRV